MSEREGMGIGSIISQHGWLYKHRDENGGLDTELLVDGLQERFDIKDRDSVYCALQFAKLCNAIYEKDGKTYINLPYDKEKKRYVSR